jgi:glycosyltransferase involved in cell wall biosynthesis
MRIAILSTPFVRVPPSGYGGTELFCCHLAEDLVRRGHRVTLFATGDSEFSGDLRAYVSRAHWPPTDDIDLAHVQWSLSEIARDTEGYDAVQINSAHGIEVARDLGLSVVYTLHHHRVEQLSRLYAAHQEVHYVGISRRQLELEVPLRNATLIHHGVDVDAYPPSKCSDGYVLHLGRFAPEKGTHLAIEAARRASVKIIVAGRAHPNDTDQRYYREEVAPRLRGPGVELAGEAHHERKVALLRGARALLCPIEWEEPFGLIAIEAMLTGTPVIGFARGSFPEIIDPGVTGLLVSDVPEMASAIHMVRGWDRMRCARRARERFSATRMADDYERLFASAASRQGDSTPVRGEISTRLARLTG